VRVSDGGKIMNALYKGVIVSGLISAVAFWFITSSLLPQQLDALFGCALIGLALTAAMIVITEYYTATEYGSGARRGRCLTDRPRHQHHRRPRGQHEIHGAAGARGVPGDLGRRTLSRACTASPWRQLRCCR
jgi:hypothetical protein